MSDRPVVLKQTDEEILKAVAFYRYMTVLDIACLFYSPSQSGLRRVREILFRLCGGADFKGGEYLYRFPVPKLEAGNPERIYTLGPRGREFLSRELGVPVPGKFRPEKGLHMSFSQVTHNLVLTRVLVAARRWAGVHPDFRLTDTRICYELSHMPASFNRQEREKGEKVSVVPDGFLLFEEFKKGVRKHGFPILLEIDRSSMSSERIKRHIVSRVEFVASGEYERVFGQKAVMIVYVATGVTGEFKEGRRKALCNWTMEALRDTGRKSWAQVFRFCSVGLQDIYDLPLFDDPLWYRPDLERPVRLFGV